MKANIHPEYFDITVKCQCGNTIKTGSTSKTLKTEYCSACHPFYTGKQKLVDTAGRVDKFEARRKAAAAYREKMKEKATVKKKKVVKAEEEKAPKEKVRKTKKAATIK